MAASTTTGINYTDLDLNFIPHPIRGDIVKLTGSTAVVRAIRNLVLTNHYEFPFQPDIGSSVKKMLFENNTGLTANFIRRSVTDVIKNFEPRVDKSSINVIVTWSQPDRGFAVSIYFFMSNQAQPIQATFLLKRPR